MSAERILREAGLKVTRSRVTVLAELDAHPHTDADSVFRGVRATLPGTSVQAVYGVLRALTDARIVRRIEPAGSAALYERRTDDNHHHLVCRSCRAVVDVDCAPAAAPCLRADDDHGFIIDEAEIVFWGQCPDCRASTERVHTHATNEEN